MTETFVSIVGKVDKITFQHKETFFSVIKILDISNNEQFVGVGLCESIAEERCYKFDGNWHTHKSFGRQFRISHYSSHIPEDDQSLLSYLSSGFIKGIGVKTAQKIVHKFDKETSQIIKNSPQRLIEVPTIGKKKLETILESLNENNEYQEEELLLSHLNLSKSLIYKIIKHYKKNTLSTVTEFPYYLSRDISGIGFHTADRIALKMGLSKSSPFRIKSAVFQVLNQLSDKGHCYGVGSQILDEMIGLLNLPKEEIDSLLQKALPDLNSIGAVYIDETKKPNRIYLMKLFLAEQEIINYIKNKYSSFKKTKSCENQWSSKLAPKMEGLSLHQKEAVEESLSQPFFIVSGGPGVGKTTTANTIIASFLEIGKTVALAAPTGRAAQRLFEASGQEAKTIHRLLEWSPQTQSFQRNEENPLTCDVLILDESSMIDILMAQHIIKALPLNCQLILIGDVDQLPPIGPGNFLKDLITSEKIRFTILKEVFRQAKNSKIIDFSHKINLGLIPNIENGLDSDCKFIEASEPLKILQTIVRLFTEIIPRKTDFSPLQDIQILSPMNRGPIGTDLINSDIRKSLFNEAYTENQFIKGDKVIQMVNNYELNIYNGDIGYVKEVGLKDRKILIEFNEKSIQYDSMQQKQLKLAYAISIHKSQGSEFPVVIMPICNSHSHMLDRNLLYTGLTRAKKLAVLVGTKKALARAIHKKSSHTRQTSIAENLFTDTP